MQTAFIQRSFLLTLFLAGICTAALAGLLPFTKSIYTPYGGAAVVVGTPTAAQSVVATTGSGTFIDQQVRNRITFGVDQQYKGYIATEADVTVQLEVKLYNASYALTSTQNISLSVQYHPFTTADYLDRQSKEFQNAYKMDFKITGITVNGVTTTTLPAHLYVTGDIFVERYTQMASPSTAIPFTNAVNIDQDGDGKADIRRITWTPTAGVEEYQLEWTFVNDYDMAASALSYDFRNNSTRVSTGADWWYDISLVFDKGWLVYRVRGLGGNTANTTVPIVGVWNVAETGTISSVASNAKFQVLTSATHERGLNWQYAATYAEEGKRKEVISYMDGSLRGRQTVTKINSDDNAIVGETIYDYQGRPAINVLPVPVKFPTGANGLDTSSTLKFYPKFNQNATGAAYSRTDFDQSEDDPCAPPLSGMNTASGASNYYSPLNPKQAREQSYVPNANQYPFTQVEYTPDNTGRISRQGGVGAEFQLGTGKETRYLYSQPEQSELDRLFGSEVGFATHYQKNTVIDANGQVSVSYLDMEGRVIATALANDAPGNMLALPSGEASATQTYVNAMGEVGELNKLNEAGNARTTVKHFSVARETQYTFDYENVFDGPFADSCLEDMCIDCVYDLTLTLINECGENLFPAALADTMIGKFTTDPEGNHHFHGICQEPMGHYYAPELFVYTLPEGSYTLTKVLRVNEEARNAYIALYMDTTVNDCVKTLYDFQQEALAGVDTSGCSVTCEECFTQLGTLEDFIANGLGSASDYYLRRDDCNRLCNGGEISFCEAAYTMLKNDMSPGGQYAQHTTTAGVFNPGAFPLSILQPVNQLPKNLDPASSYQPNGLAYWRLPRLIDANGAVHYEYREENGDRSRIPVTLNDAGLYEPLPQNPSNVMTDPLTGATYIYPEKLANVNDFVLKFKTSWAASLVTYHPEYCYYEACIEYAKPKVTGDALTSESFDEVLFASSVIDDAVTNGLLEMQGPNLVPTNWFLATTPTSAVPAWDPFVVRSSSFITADCDDFGEALRDRYNAYEQIGGTMYSMPQVAAYMARHGIYTGDPVNTADLVFGSPASTEVRTNEWHYLQAFYRSAKQELQQQRGNCKAIRECNAYNGCIGDAAYSPVQEGMLYTNALIIYYSPYFDPVQPCGVEHKNLYRYKARRFGDVSDIPVQNANQAAYQLYLQTGQCQRTFALQSLLNKLSVDDNLDASNLALNPIQEYIALFIADNNFYTPTVPVLTQQSYPGGTSLTDEWLDAGNNLVAKLMLELPGSSTLTWDDLHGILHVYPTGVNTFTAQGVYFNGTTDTLVQLTGSFDLFDLQNCTFEQDCSSNALAQDLTLLLSMLAQEDDLEATSPVALTAGPPNYAAAVTQVMYGTGTPYDRYVYVPGTHQFHFYHNAVPAQGLFLTVNSVEPAGFNWSLLGNITTFESITSGDLNTFSVVAHLSAGNTVTFHGDAVRVTGETTVGLRLGECGLPTPINCQTPEHDAFEQLEDLLYDVLVNQPFDGNSINIFASAEMSPAISWFLPDSAASSYSDYNHTFSEGSHTGELIITLPDCHIELAHSDDNAPALDLADLVAMNDFSVSGIADNNGFYHKFYFVGTFVTGGVTYMDTVWGTSCLPLKPCVTCPESPIDWSEPEANSFMLFAEMSNEECLAAYTVYNNCLKTYNEWASRKPYFQVDQLSYEDFYNNGFCSCANTFCDRLDSIMNMEPLPAYPQFQELTDLAFLCAPAPLEGCAATYQQYVQCYNTFQDWAVATEYKGAEGLPFYSYAQFSSLGYCFCVDTYCARLNNVMNGLVVFEGNNNFDVYTDFRGFCASTPPCTPQPGSGMPVISPEVTLVNNCVEMALNQALFEGQLNYELYLDSLTDVLIRRYNAHCMINDQEGLNYTYNDKLYHFMLYYYDQAGNLIKTVPPEGVELLPVGPVSGTVSGDVYNDRMHNTQTVFTNHRLATRYEYNSLNQLIAQYVPDADPMTVFDLTLPNGLPAKLETTQIQMVNGSRGYLSGKIGTRGYLYRTDDGGTTWNQVTGLVGADLKKVQLLNATTGFAIGEGGIVLRTDDAGMNWDMVYTWGTSGAGMIKNLNDFHFIQTSTNNFTGIIVGDNNAVIQATVTPTTTAFAPLTVSGVAATASVTGVSGDASNFYITVNTTSGGLTSGSVYSCALSNTSSWTAHTAFTAEALNDVDFYNATGAYAAGNDGRLYKNTDAVNSSSTTRWQLVPTDIAQPFRAVRFFNETQGIALMETAAATKTLLRTVDGGQHWAVVSDGNFNSLSKVRGGMVLATGKAGRIEILIASANPEVANIVVASPDATAEFTAGWAEAETVGTNTVLRILVATNSNLYYAANGFMTNPLWQPTPISGTIGGGNTIRQLVAQSFSGALSGVVCTSNNRIYGMGKATTALTFSFTTLSTATAYPSVAADYSNSRVVAYNTTNGQLHVATLSGSGAPTSLTANATAMTGIPALAATAYVTGKFAGVLNTGGIYVMATNPTGLTTTFQSNHTNTIQPAALYDIEYTTTGGTFYRIAGADGTFFQKTSGTPSTAFVRQTTGLSSDIRKVKTTASGIFLAGTNGLFRKGTVASNVYTSSSLALTTGQTAEQALAGVTLYDIDFSGTRMYAVGDAGTILYSPTLASVAFSRLVQGNAALYSVGFKAGLNQAYAVGANARVQELSGTSTSMKKEVFTQAVKDVHFSDAYTGTALADGFTLRTTQDGGMTWNIVKPTTAQPYFGALNKVWTIDSHYSLVFNSTGFAWQALDNVVTITTTSGLNNVTEAVKGTDSRTVYTASSAQIAQINVGAAPGYALTKTNLVVPGMASVSALHVFDNGDYALAGGATFKYYTASNALSFTATFPAGTVLNDLYFHDRINGVLVGDNGRYYTTQNQQVLSSGYLSSANTSIWVQNTNIYTSGIDPYLVDAANEINIKAIAFASTSKAILGGSYNSGFSAYADPMRCYVRVLGTSLTPYTARFYYDRLGRLVVSQNTRQYNSSPQKYSYLLYDALGRVYEAGEKIENRAIAGGSNTFAKIFGTTVGNYFSPTTISDDKLAAWIGGSGKRTEVTKSYYDKAVLTFPTSIGFIPDNLTSRQRIVHVTYEDTLDGVDSTYQHATHYIYDIHGNVKSLLQDNRRMAKDYPALAAQRYKRVDYTYDLLSGNVHRVSVENGKRDQWHHAYSYDADNRLTEAFTSKETPILAGTASPASLNTEADNSNYWERDARYGYYDHGPLARVELGAHQLQGMDYVYNLQGWLKGVNSVTLTEARDPGNDNDYGGSSPNQPFAKDVMGFALDYYATDYTPINTAKTGLNAFEASPGTFLTSNSANLYNGNIKVMQTTITNPTTNAVMPLATAYRYDQLNRLRTAVSTAGMTSSTNSWDTTASVANMYKNSFTYDANGNIKTQQRYSSTGTFFDNLSYNYDMGGTAGKLQRNRLYHLKDARQPIAATDDIDDQDVSGSPFNATTLANANYAYDEEGRLVKDKQEKIDQIVWRVDGKVKAILRNTGVSNKKVTFDYDAMGNRVAKHVYNNATGVLEKSTYYVLDAAGNTMNTYEYVISGTATYKLTERQVYGASRLGMSTVSVDMLASLVSTDPLSHKQGFKFFEMSNHLGNVLAVVKDKVKPMDANPANGIVDGRQVYIANVSDYSPFGAPLDGRNIGGADYRFGFNGMEGDDEIKGNGNSYTTEFRQYDPRLGRWLTPDPKMWKYPTTSPYAAFNNNPIYFIDPRGDDPPHNSHLNRNNAPVLNPFTVRDRVTNDISSQKNSDFGGFRYLENYYYMQQSHFEAVKGFDNILKLEVQGGEKYFQRYFVPNIDIIDGTEVPDPEKGRYVLVELEKTYEISISTATRWFSRSNYNPNTGKAKDIPVEFDDQPDLVDFHMRNITREFSSEQNEKIKSEKYFIPGSLKIESMRIDLDVDNNPAYNIAMERKINERFKNVNLTVTTDDYQENMAHQVIIIYSYEKFQEKTP